MFGHCLEDVLITQHEAVEDGDLERGLGSKEYLGFVETRIVGIRYYDGTVSRNEMVLLVREPTNPYDRWAIRVDNARYEKVGHIPRTVVEYISPLVDAGELYLEATIPYGENNAYSIPLVMYCYGSREDYDHISSALSRAGLFWRRESILSSPIGSSLPSARQSPMKSSSEKDRSREFTTFTRRLSSTEIAKRVESVLDNFMKDDCHWATAEPSKIVKTKLFQHQKEALAWMISKENSRLNNEIPVFWEEKQGRYIHTLCNFLQKERPDAICGGILADDMGLGKSLTTISLICTNPEVVPKHTVDIELEETPQGKRQKSSKLGDSSSKRRMKKSNKVVDKSADSTTQPTLILCPLSVLGSWEQQFEEHVVPGTLKVYKYHGPQRDRRVKFLSEKHVVISTYSTLAAEFRDNCRNGLLGVNWLRIVADEGHVLKNLKTQMSQAACKLKAERKWILSGTPIQNSLTDLQGLLAYLDLKPLHDTTIFRRTIERPIMEGRDEGVKRLQALVCSLALRRTKETKRDGRRLVSLPSKQIYEVTVQFTDEGREKYHRWKDAGDDLILYHLNNDSLMENYTIILTMILRLRQIAADPSLVRDDEIETIMSLNSKTGKYTKITSELMEKLVETLRSGMDGECAICLDPLLDPVITTCSHIFCKPCINAVIVQDKDICPLCRSSISPRGLIEMPKEKLSKPQANDSTGNFGPKIQALLKQISSSSDSEKHIVFSQFTGMLNLAANGLQNAGLKFLRLDGSTPSKRRSDMLKIFSESSEVRIFLVSLKAGGVGLNLTAANHCHLLDPWWNPAIEEQAADRVHRLGQTRPVFIWRYITEGSIEKKLLDLQEQKRQLMKHAFERHSAKEVRTRRINDVRMLMDLNQ